jgi:membrane protein DedA with SNARE-associated domain
MSDWIIEIVKRLGYAGIAALTFLENLFPPIPSELIMPLAGFQAAQGEMSIAWAIAAGSLGSLLGACVWYWLGMKIGEARLRLWVERHGRWIAMDCEDIDRAKHWFDRHGLWAIFACRLVPGLRTYISLPAGLARMPLPRFLAASAAGTVIWTAGLTLAGSLLGQNYPNIGQALGIASWIVVGGVVAAYVWRQARWTQTHGSAERRGREPASPERRSVS